MKSTGAVFVIDDDDAVRASTGMLFESLGFDVHTFRSAEQFLASYTPETHGCLILELKLPGMSGLELQQRLESPESGVEIVFLTAHGDIGSALRAVKHGACHFLAKPAREQELVDAVNRALRRERSGRGRLEARRLLRTRLSLLTPRESQVLHHVLDGRATKIISQALGISERTVEAHRARAFAKLDVRSIPELIRAMGDRPCGD